jgi:DNA-binding CsgD family transcriptional regulator
LRGQIALEQQRGSDAARLLLSAAGRLTPLDAPLARETHLEALLAALWAGDLDRRGGVLTAAEAARAAPPAPEPPRAVDVVLDAFAIRLTEGYEAGAPQLTRALELLLAQDIGNDEAGRSLWLAASRSTQVIAVELWDADAVHTLATRQLEVAREAGALVQLRLALNFLGGTLVYSGELATAELLFDEDRLVAEATGNQRVLYNDVLLAVWRGQEPKATELLEATRRGARARGMGRFVSSLTHLESVLNNALGRYEAARQAAQQAFERDDLGFGSLIVPELAEAASRTGDAGLLHTALEWLTERARVTPTDWARGVEARVRALSSDGEAAEALYREALEHLGRTRLRIELARTHLLYGEWLRREQRRVDARTQLRAAYELLSTMGAEGFAQRAQRELLATGETVRKRRVETRGDLTAQETQIARLARDGLTNPEIGAQLFISPRTVKYHLRKVFLKLGISSRVELERVLPGDAAVTKK